MNYCVCTDMKETDIVFGGEKKAQKKAIDEVVKIFHPEAITICATCPVGLSEMTLNPLPEKLKRSMDQGNSRPLRRI